MKLKPLIQSIAAAFILFMVNGCYTQMSRPDSEKKEPEYTENTEPVEEQGTRDNDVRREAHVYDYGDYYYGRPWYDPYDAWWYRYPRTGLYVAMGYNWYNPYWYDPFWSPGWCGSGWDPWWGPSYWYSPWAHPGYYGPYHVYDPYPQGGGSYTPEKRPFARRSTERDRNGQAPNTGAIAKRGSLSSPTESIYVRGEDGSYRRERRRIAEPVATTGGSATQEPPASDRRRVSREEPAQGSGGTISMPAGGSGGSVARPARTPEVQSEPQRRTREKSPEGGGVERRSRPSDKTSKPARDQDSSRRSTTSGNSSTGRGYSGSSGSSTSSSGGSSSARGSSGSSSSGSSGSSRRSKN